MQCNGEIIGWIMDLKQSFKTKANSNLIQVQSIIVNSIFIVKKFLDRNVKVALKYWKRKRKYAKEFCIYFM